MNEREHIRAQVAKLEAEATIPPETLAALKAGTWKAVPKKPTDKMEWAGNAVGLIGYDTKGCPVVYSAMLAAAPKKPESS